MYKIIIVDDEDFLRECLCDYLTSEGYECRQASNGAEALKILEREKFDAVITDIMMPEMDGITMLDKLSSRRFPQPVLIMTGGEVIENRRKAFQAGAQGFLGKPFSPREFRAEFDRMMREYALALPSDYSPN